MTREAEVVVIGGGIVGCAAAYYLARRGVRPLLLERAEVAGQQSGRNWGFVRQQGRDPLEVPLMVEANRIWRGLTTELGADIDWVQGGNLALAADEARMGLFEQWLDVARQFGLDTRLLRGREIETVVPGIQGTWRGGMYTPSDGHAEPVKATEAFARAAVAHGAALQPRCAVQALLTRSGEISGVVTEQGEVADDPRGLRRRRLVGPPAADRRAQPPAAPRCGRPWPGPRPAPPITRAGVWGPAVAFRQRPDGPFNLAAGGATDYDVTLDSLRHLRLFLPNYWKNRTLFRFHVGRPLWRDLGRSGRRPRAGGSRSPRTGTGAAAQPRQGAAEPGGAPPALPRPPGALAIERSWAGYIDATPDAVPVLGAVTSPAGSSSPRASAATGSPWARSPAAGRRARRGRQGLARPPRVPLRALRRGRRRPAAQRAVAPGPLDGRRPRRYGFPRRSTSWPSPPSRSSRSPSFRPASAAGASARWRSPRRSWPARAPGRRLHSFAVVSRERALAEARAAEAALRGGQDLGPLHGIPYGAKDLYDVKGLPTTAGTRLLATNVAREDCAVVRKLAGAGMVLLGKTHTVQFAFGGVGINHDQGTPHNPWHAMPHAPGGSSSGTGVAVAAGLVPMALGSDTGGSVRLPAALCGTSGSRPRSAASAGPASTRCRGRSTAWAPSRAPSRTPRSSTRRSRAWTSGTRPRSASRPTTCCAG